MGNVESERWLPVTGCRALPAQAPQESPVSCHPDTHATGCELLGKGSGKVQTAWFSASSTVVGAQGLPGPCGLQLMQQSPCGHGHDASCDSV